VTQPARISEVNILVVDDHPENVLALAAILARPDYNIVTANSGADALKEVLRHEFAVILLDVMMPRMDGFETAALIRQRPSSSDIPIIFLTANGANLSLIYKAYSVGAVDYLVKPIDPDIVKAKVGVFVDLFRKTAQIRGQEEQLREAERARSEEDLRDRDAEYEATFEQAPAGIAHASPDGQWLRVNQRFCEITGYSRAELMQLRFQDLTHPDEASADVAAFRKMLTGEIGEYKCEKRYLHKTGEVVWVNLTVSALRGRAGRKFVTVIEDITDRKHAEEGRALLAAASEALLSSLDYRATLARVAHLVVPAMAEWCIVDVADGPGGALSEVAVAHTDPEQAERLRELREQLAASSTRPMTQVLESGRPRVIPEITEEILAEWAPDAEQRAGLRELGLRSMLVVPLLARDRTLGGIAFVSSDPRRRYGARDVGMAEELARRASFAIDNARLYQETREAVAARDEFLSIASHELRTPLTPLQLQLERLLGAWQRGSLPTLPHERLGKILEGSERQVRRLTALIDSLLDVTRITSGRMRLQLEDVDVRELVRDVIARFDEELARERTTLALHADVAAVGRWDRLRIEQVVTNLIANAIKYGLGNPIEVTVEVDRDTARILVKDRGIGIEPDKLPRIFDRFERAVSPRAYGGLGLGLYIARQVLEAHRGSIAVLSEPGAGSVFRVELPLRTREQEDDVSSPARGAELIESGPDGRVSQCSRSS
jgi:PAS domain S-box-containing protein